MPGRATRPMAPRGGAEGSDSAILSTACPPRPLPSLGSGRNSLEDMVAPTGVEPVARGLGNRCSIRLSYGATGGRL